jgi:3-oxoacyl-[acyl-carrier protein] reductase
LGIGQPNDISPTAVYLASSDSKYLTGEIIRVTGGIL